LSNAYSSCAVQHVASRRREVHILRFERVVGRSK
jgi:hypothetical protein